MSTCLAKIEPENSPLLWLTLNVICLILSIFFFVVIGLAKQGSISSFIGLYMFYNLLLCIVWIFEVTLPIMIHGWGVVKNWYKKIEILVVLYFMVDAVITIFAYDKLMTDKIWVLIDAIITTLLFLYMTMETVVLLQYAKTNNSDYGTDISLRRINDDEQEEEYNVT